MSDDPMDQLGPHPDDGDRSYDHNHYPQGSPRDDLANLLTAIQVVDGNTPAAQTIRRALDAWDTEKYLPCTCDYSGQPDESHKLWCEQEYGPHAECATRIDALKTELRGA